MKSHQERYAFLEKHRILMGISNKSTKPQRPDQTQPAILACDRKRPNIEASACTIISLQSVQRRKQEREMQKDERIQGTCIGINFLHLKKTNKQTNDKLTRLSLACLLAIHAKVLEHIESKKRYS